MIDQLRRAFYRAAVDPVSAWPLAIGRIILGVTIFGWSATMMFDVGDLPQNLVAEVEHFFEVYKDLEPGKSVEGATWVGRSDAEIEIHQSWERYRSSHT